MPGSGGFTADAAPFKSPTPHRTPTLPPTTHSPPRPPAEFVPGGDAAAGAEFAPQPREFVPRGLAPGGGGPREFVPAPKEFVPAPKEFVPGAAGPAVFTPAAVQELAPEFVPGLGGAPAAMDPAEAVSAAMLPVRVVYPSMLPSIARREDPDAAETYFMAERLRTELMLRQFMVQLGPDEPSPGAPASVDNYHTLYPIEPLTMAPSDAFVTPNVLYKAVSMKDGLPYCLRRVVGLRLTEPRSMERVEAWKRVQHPNVVALREAFTTKDFGDSSLVFIHDYHPRAETLGQRHLGGPRRSPPPEALLWSYVIQLTAALRAVHAAGLACRVLVPSKVMVLPSASVGGPRLLVGAVGVLDVMQYSEAATEEAAVRHGQQEDLAAMGALLLALMSGSAEAASPEHFAASLQQAARRYSPDLIAVVDYLCRPAPPGQLKDAAVLLPRIGARFLTQCEHHSRAEAALEGELGKELQNGRLFRLVAKLEFVVDRPEQRGDPRWSDAGDRFLLKLFRHYIFHQADSAGRPWMDLPHVVATLNKLDAGSMEQVCLVTPDEKNIMVVTYAEVKASLDQAFGALATAQ